MRFRNREEAGRKLARLLQNYKGQNVVVFALPRGGVVTGAEIARALRAPFDLIITRKIGHPFSPEYAIAAVSESGELEVSPGEVAQADQEWFRKELQLQQEEIKRRKKVYLAGRPSPQVKGQIAILVDDGLATGLTMKAAIKELKQRQPGKIIVAVPVGPPDTIQEIAALVDEMVVVYAPEDFFGAIGLYYDYFPQLTDEEVIKLMQSVNK